jgi:hypothetical protein
MIDPLFEKQAIKIINEEMDRKLARQRGALIRIGGSDMSLEQSLERIAVTLELIVGHVVGVGQAPTPKVKPGRPAKSEALPAAPAEDLLGVDAKPEITQDDIHLALRVYMKKNALEKTKALMIKHGADPAKPVLSSIPAKSYVALMADIEESFKDQKEYDTFLKVVKEGA